MFNKERFDAAVDALPRIGSSGISTFGPRILVLRDESDEITQGGIVIPDEAKRNERVGTVLHLGTGFEDTKDEYYVKHSNGEDLAVGDRVTFNAYDGVVHDIDTRLGRMEVIAFHLGNLYNGWKP